MKAADISGVIGKLSDARKSFLTSFANVDKQWSDVARKQFEDDYISTVEPNVKSILEVAARLATLLANAEQQCGPDHE
jgi:hypothetical protein